MNARAADFEFVDDYSTLTRDLSSHTRVVRIPAGVKRKRQLLATLSSSLKFPDYFGGNWDALEECLGDLSWLNGVTKLTLIHADVPCAENRQTLATYLAILQTRIWDKAPQSRLELRVVFPQASREVVQTILNS